MIGGAELSVGIGDLQVARKPTQAVVTHALGSCVGVFAWDPETQVGGCLHYLLPKGEGSQSAPAKYGDSGLPLLLSGVAPLPTVHKRLRLVACGGAQMNGDGSLFRIGQRNVAALRQYLWQSGLLLAAEDFGGTAPRTARLDLRTGRVTVRSGLKTTIL